MHLDGGSVGRAPGPGASLSVFLVDPQVVVREGLRLLIDACPDLTVVGQASTAHDAGLLDAKPDVIVTEIDLPDRRGPEVVVALRATFPQAHILVLTENRYLPLVEEVLAIGAEGYLLGSAEVSEFFDALRRVADGDVYLQPQLGVELVRMHAAAPKRRGRPRTGAALSPDEVEVLRRLAHGFTNEEIARLRGRSLRTVEGQRASIVRKLGCTSRAELVRYAYLHGLVDPPHPEQDETGGPAK